MRCAKSQPAMGWCVQARASRGAWVCVCVCLKLLGLLGAWCRKASLCFACSRLPVFMLYGWMAGPRMCRNTANSMRSTAPKLKYTPFKKYSTKPSTFTGPCLSRNLHTIRVRTTEPPREKFQLHLRVGFTHFCPLRPTAMASLCVPPRRGRVF
jgi:hypothetical protein